jgi:hypothetical protein
VPGLTADALPSAVLIWDAGQVRPICERSAELKRNVAAYLGREVFEADAPLTIRVSLRRSADNAATVADVEKLGADGKVWGVRSVSGGESCEQLDDPLTLVVALMLDAPPAAAEPETRDTPVPSAPEPAELEPAPSSSEPSPDESELEPGFVVVGAGVGSALGQLPFPNFGPRLQFNLKPRRFWGIEVSGQGLGGSRIDLPGSGRVDFRMLQVGAALCPVDRFNERVWLSVCAGLDLVWLEARSRDLSQNRRRTEFVLTPTLRVQLARELGASPISFGGLLGASIPTVRNRFVYRDGDGASRQAFEVATPALLFGAFVALRLH